MEVRMFFAGVFGIAAILPIHASWGGCPTGWEFGQYRDRVDKIKAELVSSCGNPEGEQLAAAEPCAELPADSRTFCKPLCSENFLQNGEEGSGYYWKMRMMPDGKYCALSRRAQARSAIPGGPQDEARADGVYRSLKARWLKEYQGRRGVRELTASYLKDVQELMKDPGLEGVKDPSGRSAEEIVAQVREWTGIHAETVRAMEKPGTLTLARAGNAQDSYHRLVTGCDEPIIQGTTACASGAPPQPSMNDLNLLLDQAMERAGERFPHLRERIEKVQHTSDLLNRDLALMNGRMNELRMIAQCRALKSELKTLASRFTAACERDAQCFSEMDLPVDAGWVRNAYAPVRATFIQARPEAEAPKAPAEAPKAPAAAPAKRVAPVAERAPKAGWNFEHLEDMVNRAPPERGI